MFKQSIFALRSMAALTSAVVIGAGFAESAEAVTFTTTLNSFGGDPATVESGLCSTFGLCTPGQEVLLLDSTPGQETPPLPVVNDTGFTITGLFGRLPLVGEVPGLDQPSAFSQEGSSSDIFNQINVSNGRQEIAFTDGVIPKGSTFEVNILTKPTANASLFSRFEAKPVPEASSTLAFLAFSVVAASKTLKKKEA